MTTEHRTCTRCKRTKGHPAFAKHGTDSWCRMCHNEANRQHKRDNQANVRAYKQLERKHPNPTEYSRLHCAHIAHYATKAIQRFERLTGMEAPPHLVSIKALAIALVEQHPLPPPQVCHNPKCNKPIEGRKRLYCDAYCRDHAGHLRRATTA